MGQPRYLAAQACAAVAQLVRALDCGSRGPLFKPGQLYHSISIEFACPIGRRRPCVFPTGDGFGSILVPPPIRVSVPPRRSTPALSQRRPQKSLRLKCRDGPVRPSRKPRSLKRCSESLSRSRTEPSRFGQRSSRERTSQAYPNERGGGDWYANDEVRHGLISCRVSQVGADLVYPSSGGRAL